MEFSDWVAGLSNSCVRRERIPWAAERGDVHYPRAGSLVATRSMPSGGNEFSPLLGD